MTSHSSQKFRPYFTREELLEIISALKSSPTPRRLTLCQYLEIYLVKINHGIIKPSHTLEPSLESKLGFSEQSSGVPISHELTGEMAYNKHLINPLNCTPKEIAEAMDWRYRNDLMSPDEEKAYEQANGF